MYTLFIQERETKEWLALQTIEAPSRKKAVKEFLKEHDLTHKQWKVRVAE